MGRPESRLNPDAGPVEEFAWELRQLRSSAGGCTYRELARQTKFSPAALAAAARGEQLPSLAVALAYAEACDGDRDEWERRWRFAETAIRLAEGGGAGQRQEVSPYLGLAAFEEADADRFFGRDRLVAGLLAQVRQSPFVTVVGPSGSGKSSLLRAGVIPGARDGLPGGSPLRALVFTPGPDPVAALMGALAGVAPRPSPGSSVDPLPVGDVTRLADRAGVPGGGLLVVVDQFEEVFTLCADQGERSGFIDLLLSARSAGSRVRVVLGLRGDFYGHCAAHRGLAEAVSAASVLVGPLTASELREVIVKPASREHAMVEPDLVATVIGDASDEPGMLPLVSHALLETWRRRRGKALTLYAYQASGGVHGAIAQTAEAVYAVLSADQQEVARRILLRLITMGEDAQVTRRPLRRTDLPGGQRDGEVVLGRLADARLVTLDEDLVRLAHEAVIDSWPRLGQWLDGDREGLRIRQQLTEAAQAWQELDRDSDALYRGVRLAIAREWAEHVGNAAELTTVERSFLGAGLAAQEAEQTAIRRRTRRLRALAVTLTVLLIIAIGAGWVARRQSQIADRRLSEARSRDLAGQAHASAVSDPARAAQLAVRAFRAARTAQARGALLSIAATQRSGSLLGSHAGPANAVALSPDGRLLASGGTGSVILWDLTREVRLATLPAPAAAGAGPAQVDRPGPSADEHGLSRPRADGPGVEALAFSSDGRLLAGNSSRHDGGRVVRVWDVASRRQITVRAGSAARESSGDDRQEGSAAYEAGVAFSPDGRQVAFNDEQRVTVWDLADSTKTRVYEGLAQTARLWRDQGEWLRSTTAASPTTDARDLPGRSRSAFPFELFAGNSRAGNVLLTSEPGRLGGPVMIDARSGRRLLKLPVDQADQAGPPATWQLSPDGRLLYTAGPDNTISVWDVARRTRIITLTGHTDVITDLTISRDGRLLVSAGTGGSIRVWDQTRMPLIGHSAAVNAITYSPDGRTLASASADTTARLWDPAGHIMRAFLPAGPRQELHAIAYTPHTNTLLVGGDQSVHWWNTADPQHPKPFPAHDDPYNTSIKALALSPVRPQLATLSDDGRIALTDLRAGQPVDMVGDAIAYHPNGGLAIARDTTVTLHDGPRSPTFTGDAPITSLAFSPDGRLMATAGQDGSVLIWDTRRRTRIATLTGHSAPANTVAFSPDGGFLAIGGRDRAVIIWDLAHRTQWATLTGHTDTITSLAFHPDGTTLATASADHSIALWPLHATTALTTLCSRTQSQDC